MNNKNTTKHKSTKYKQDILSLENDANLLLQEKINSQCHLSDRDQLRNKKYENNIEKLKAEIQERENTLSSETNSEKSRGPKLNSYIDVLPIQWKDDSMFKGVLFKEFEIKPFEIDSRDYSPSYVSHFLWSQLDDFKKDFQTSTADPQ